MTAPLFLSSFSVVRTSLLRYCTLVGTHTLDTFDHANHKNIIVRLVDLACLCGHKQTLKNKKISGCPLIKTFLPKDTYKWIENSLHCIIFVKYAKFVTNTSWQCLFAVFLLRNAKIHKNQTDFSENVCHMSTLPFLSEHCHTTMCNYLDASQNPKTHVNGKVAWAVLVLDHQHDNQSI